MKIHKEMKKIMQLDKLESQITKYQKYDIFAGKIPINVNKFESISSYEGTCLTFIFYILLIIYIFLNIPGDIFWRELPNVSQSYINVDHTHKVNFTKSNDKINNEFFFYFSITGKNNRIFNDESYIYPRLRIKTINNTINKNATIQYFDFKRCDLESLDENIKYFDNSTKDRLIRDFYCPNFKDFIINGSAMEDSTNIGQIVIYPCSFNNDGERKCKSDNEIGNYIYDNHLKVKLIYPVPVVNAYDISQPMNFTLAEDYYYLNRDITHYHYVNYQFDKIELISDMNIIKLAESEYLHEYELKFLSRDSRKTDIDDPRMFSIDFRSSIFMTTYKRSYLKLLDCLSIIGGFYPILYMLFELVYSFFSQFPFLEYMMDKIFKVNNPLEYNIKPKINIDLSKYDVPEKKKIPPTGKSAWWKKRNSMIDKSVHNHLGRTIELRDLNESPNKDDKIEVDKIIDLRIKNQDCLDYSENRLINSKNNSDNTNKDIQDKIIPINHSPPISNLKNEGLFPNEDGEIIDKSKKEQEKNESNGSIKDYYIQTLKNMRGKFGMKFEIDFKAYYNYIKFVGYGKNETSKFYKVKKMMDKIQDKVYDYFDYLNVIRCIDELALIKSFLFEEHELPIISTLRIPIVDLGEEFDLEKNYNIKFANHAEKKIKDEDLETGIEKILQDGKNRQISQKILKHLRNLNKEN